MRVFRGLPPCEDVRTLCVEIDLENYAQLTTTTTTTTCKYFAWCVKVNASERVHEDEVLYRSYRKNIFFPTQWEEGYEKVMNSVACHTLFW